MLQAWTKVYGCSRSKRGREVDPSAVVEMDTNRPQYAPSYRVTMSAGRVVFTRFTSSRHEAMLVAQDFVGIGD